MRETPSPMPPTPQTGHSDFRPARPARKRRSSWKTTFAGIATAIGATLLGLPKLTGVALPPEVVMVGTGLSIFGPALMGIKARDKDVSSEDEGAN